MSIRGCEKRNCFDCRKACDKRSSPSFFLSESSQKNRERRNNNRGEIIRNYKQNINKKQLPSGRQENMRVNYNILDEIQPRKVRYVGLMLLLLCSN